MSLITLYNQYISTVNWENGALCDHNVGGSIDLWQININDNLPQINKFRYVLAPDEITRANKYLRASDGDKFIISRGGLRYILSEYLKCAPGEIRFNIAANNKPEIDYPSITKLHFNLSDSADKVLIAIAASPVGIDVELINPKFSYQAILNNNFSPLEAEYINDEDSFKRFFLLWTRKEAILKATGIGLTDHLKLIPSLNGQHVIDGSLLSTVSDWQLKSFEISGDYIATIASNALKNNHRFWNFLP